MVLLYDDANMLIASGGTAGYCAVSRKAGSPYALEYIQAWLANPYTEKYIRISGSDFEGGFIARGTLILNTLPFVELGFSNENQKLIHDRVVEAAQKIYGINDTLSKNPEKSTVTVLQRQKQTLISEIENLISRIYRLEF